MITHSIATKSRLSDANSSTGVISFPSCFRVRCPHCGSDRQPSGKANLSNRYLCMSDDDSQSETCTTWANERDSQNLVSEVQAILTKFGFGPVSRLRVAE
jgi:hypothetical protein